MDIEAGIKKTRELERLYKKECSWVFICIVEILAAMRPKQQGQICNAIIQHTVVGEIKCANTKPCLVHDIPQQPQDPCEVPEETVGFPENVVKTWLTTCQKIHQDTIFIDRKVAESRFADQFGALRITGLRIADAIRKLEEKP